METFRTLNIAFDLTFIVKKSQRMLSDDEEKPVKLPPTERSLAIADMVISVSGVIFSMILFISSCVFAVPEKARCMKYAGRSWIAILGISALWKIFESTYNTLPQEEFEYVVTMPEFGVEEITGNVAIIISWAFTGFYLFLYIIMAIVVSSQITMLQLMVWIRACPK